MTRHWPLLLAANYIIPLSSATQESHSNKDTTAASTTGPVTSTTKTEEPSLRSSPTTVTSRQTTTSIRPPSNGDADALIFASSSTIANTNIVALTSLADSVVIRDQSSVLSPASSVAPDSRASTSTPVINDKPAKLSDRSTSIILGVSIGAVALAVLVVMMFLIHRRKTKTGTFFKRSSAYRSWASGEKLYDGRPPTSIHSSAYSSVMSTNDRLDPGQPENTITHPAYAHDLSGRRPRRLSKHGPNHVPLMSGPLQPESHDRCGVDAQSEDLEAQKPTKLRSRSSDAVFNDRLQVPWSPDSWMGRSSPPLWHTPYTPDMDSPMLPQAHLPQLLPLRINNDMATRTAHAAPVVPSKHPNRRQSPLVHYPSWDEVEAFSFSNERQVHVHGGLQQKDEDNHRRESAVGRVELA